MGSTGMSEGLSEALHGNAWRAAHQHMQCSLACSGFGIPVSCLFQEVRGGDLLEVYERMVKYNRTDPRTFSSNDTLHQQRVRQGDAYVYINDKTGLEITISEECDLDIIKEEFMPAEYGVGLRNNSFFRDAFSAEWVDISLPS